VAVAAEASDVETIANEEADDSGGADDGDVSTWGIIMIN
jgi:hypothetical protein